MKEKLTVIKSLESTTQQFLKPLPCWLTLVVNQVLNSVNEITANQILSLTARNLMYRAKTSPLTKPLVMFRVSRCLFQSSPKDS